MANYKVDHQGLAADLIRCVCDEDVIGARRLLVRIDEQDKKIIFEKLQDDYAPLCVAAGQGNKDMVEFLVKRCQVNIEGSGEKCDRLTLLGLDSVKSVTPLWCAAKNGKLEVVKLLQELGADINAVTNTETTSVNNACFERRTETVKFLVKQGADIHRPDKRGLTCLMNSVYSLELCQLLIDNGAQVNEQDELGNTALHHAIMKGELDTVQFLLDHGSDQNIKNNIGDDALQLASLRGKELIVNELEARQKPSTSRWIESLQLLGSNSIFSGVIPDIERALVFWRRSVEIQMLNRNIESIPASTIFKKVNTVEELEKLCQNRNKVHMYALENLLRILGHSHTAVTSGLVSVSKVLAWNGRYKRSCDLLKFALQLVQVNSPTFTKEYACVVEMMYRTYSAAFLESKSQIKVRDVLEIVDLVTLKAQVSKKLEFPSMWLILQLVHLVVKLDKNAEQTFRFKQLIHRLVHSQIRSMNGRTFLHYAVEQNSIVPGVVQVLLECGADVNSFDEQNNTPLHLVNIRATWLVYRLFPSFEQENFDEKNNLVELLLRYSGHPEAVNDFGDFAAKGLSLKMLDHVNLKCLATTVIRDHQIPYVGQIPESLVSFVQMHGRCRSWLSFLQQSYLD